MKNKILLFLAIFGLVSLFTGCEESGEKIYLATDPIAPSLQTVPDLTLERNNAEETLVFVGTPVDLGFTASATYILEACETGNGFVDVLQIYTDTQDTLISFTVKDLNSILIKQFPADETTSIDLRIRAVLIVSAGTSAPGTGDDPFEYISDAVTVNITTFGLPRLDLTGTDQKVESAAGDGVYSGFVKLEADVTFTLTDPDSETSYGMDADGTTLVVDGDGKTPATAGWYKLTVDVNTMTYSFDAYMIGVVGSATPNGWDVPDIKMDYDKVSETWQVTTALADGEMKFRRNDDWAWNLGGTESALEHNGANIAVSAGTYFITLTITNDVTGSETGTYTIESVE